MVLNDQGNDKTVNILLDLVLKLFSLHLLFDMRQSSIVNMLLILNQTFIREFFSVFFNRSHYAVGAPKGKKAQGAVYICHRCFTRNHDTSKDIVIKGGGVSYGSRFGQALAAVNITGKGADELVVGAPLHSENDDHDFGVVKVYQIISNQRKSKEVAELKPPQLTPGSRFGSAIENLGDIHNDDFEDFVVSAPYFGDDKAGAIFIYRGNVDFNFGK